MIIHVVAALPNEGCGLLAGVSGCVLQVYPVTNVEKSPDKYRMDAKEQLRSMIAIEQAKLEMLGIFHSHPCGPPTPSETDREQSYYPEVVHVILSPAVNCGWQARGFRLNKHSWLEVTLQTKALGNHP